MVVEVPCGSGGGFRDNSETSIMWEGDATSGDLGCSSAVCQADPGVRLQPWMTDQGPTLLVKCRGQGGSACGKKLIEAAPQKLDTHAHNHTARSHARELSPASQRQSI